MAISINRVILAGNMTRDPEFRHLPSNTGVCGFGLATNRRFKNASGETQEETTFVDCEAFGKQAEVLRDYGAKGRGLFVEGRLKLDQWQDKDGGNRSKLKVIVDRVQFTDRRPESDAGSGQSEPVRRATGGVPLEEVLPF